MGKLKTPRLAFRAEYVSPDTENSDDVNRARLELMRIVKEVFPKFLEKLAADVFPLFDQAATDGKLERAGYNFELVLFSDNFQRALDALAEENGVKAALLNWATDFNAATDWLMVRALRTLRSWHIAPASRQQLRWETGHSLDGPPAIGKPFEFSFSGWETRLVTWAHYCEVARRRFEEKLSEYERETRELVESEGLIRARRTYSRVNLEWFVLYQFAGESSKRIAERAAKNGKAVDDSTVLKGIKAAAKLIGWKHLRKPKRLMQNRKIR